MRITNGMLHFCTKHPWVVHIFFPHPRRTHGETRNLTDPPKSTDCCSRWLVHKAQCPTTDAEQFGRRDNGMPIFYCCHILPCCFLPDQLNIASVKAQLRWPWVSIWNQGLKIVESMHTSYFPFCFFFPCKSPENLPQTAVCFLLQFTSTGWSWGLLSVRLCYWFVCVCVCVFVYRGPSFLWRKETVKPTCKFIHTASGAQFIHLKTLLLCWVKCPEIFGAVLTTILRFHVASGAIFGSCDSFAPWGLTQNLHSLDTSIDFPSLWAAVMDGAAAKSSAGQVGRVSELSGAISNVSQWLLRCQWCRFKCWSLADAWPTGCNALLKKWNLPKLFILTVTYCYWQPHAGSTLITCQHKLRMWFHFNDTSRRAKGFFEGVASFPNPLCLKAKSSCSQELQDSK